MRARQLALGLLLALSLTSLPAFADWREPFGGDGHLSSNPDVRAPLTAPVEAWRAEYGTLLGEPVVASGTVFVAARTKRSARLYALDLATGKELHSTKIAAEDYAYVSVLDAAVVAVTDEAHYYFEFRGGKFKRGKVVREVFTSPASLLPGLSFVTTGESIVALGLRSGKRIFEAPADPLKPLVSQGVKQPFVAFVHSDTGARDDFAVVEYLHVMGVGTSEPSIVHERSVGSPVVLRGGDVLSADSTTPFLMMVGKESGAPLLLVAASSEPKASTGRARYFFGGHGGRLQLPVIHRDPAMLGGSLVGRLEDGTVAITLPDGKSQTMVPVDARPRGAVDGPITTAGDVLVLGNWAFEYGTGRILWVDPEMDFQGPLLPVADGTVLYQRGEGTLVCAKDTNASSGGGLAAAARPELPTALDGMEPYQALKEARRALDYALADDLGKVFEAYSKKRLLGEARRVLAEAQERGLPHDAAADFAAKLSGKSENKAGNRDRQLAAASKKEAEVRAKAAGRTLAFAGEMVDAGLGLEAASLAGDVPGYFTASAGMPDEVGEQQRALSLASMPPEFPFSSDADASDQWLRWAIELAPAGARFVDPKDILDAKRKAPIDGQPRPEFKNSPIWSLGTIALRSKNLAVLSRSSEPEIVGACLRTGEDAIRTLESVLGNPPSDDDAPLEVRIHSTRRDYLRENLGEGQRASEWSLGFYAPWLMASRFHVPDAETSLNQGRALHEVVAHELTHQYIAERWREVASGQRTSITPGFWIVEGFARFIEDQSLEIARRGDALDDPTVLSVESAAALHAAGGGLRLKDLLRLDQLKFRGLPDDDIGTVEISSTLVRLTHTPKSAFYDQSAALVFFLANRCGPQGRQRLLGTVRAHYLGETGLTPWKELGFKTRASLERAFAAFLENPAGGHVEGL